MTPLQTAGLCGLLIVGLAGYGLYERHQGAIQAQAADRLRADSVIQDSTLRAYKVRVAQDSAKIARQGAVAASENVRATGAQHRADSLETALKADTGTFVLRDSAIQVVAARDSQIAHLTLANVALTEESAILLRGIASRDSTIIALSAQLTGVRHDLAAQLGVHPGVFATVGKYVEAGLALYGGIRLVRG